MFQFTREFIINDKKGKLSGGVKFLTKADNSVMFVDNLINLRAKDVKAIYKYPYAASANEVVAVDLNGKSISAGTLYRLVITLGQEGRVISTYNDAYPDHSREFFYEAVADDTSVSKLAQAFVKSWENEKTYSDVKFVTLSYDENANTKLTITAPDCFTRVKSVRLVSVPNPAHTTLTGFEDYVTLIDKKRKDFTSNSGEVALTTEGKLGNGNAVQILNDMRLRTAANIDPFGTQMDERPIPGGQYDQYLVELVTERRHIGHDVMGSIGASLTSHVFYVLTGVGDSTCDGLNISEAFATELAKLGVAIQEVGPKLSSDNTPTKEAAKKAANREKVEVIVNSAAAAGSNNAPAAEPSSAPTQENEDDGSESE